ncbi:MAG: transglutaminase domain-containing protein [Clostridia bacterium]|nr:transglutaminase domain-containing protein [Clostridia bacterium]
MKNATVLLLTAAFLFGWVASSPLPAAAETAAHADPAAILLGGLTDCRETIDLSGASLPVSELGRVYLSVLHSHPELFHVAPRLSYSYTERDGTRAVTEVYPAYTLTGDALAAARAFYRDTLAAILAEMELTFGGSPRTEADTVLYLHDYLADRYTYDTRAESPNADAYTFLRDGAGICQAYALTFLALCRGAGLEADLVVSDAMDHAWNHVRVDGVWYHVDVTRDDPIPAAQGTDEVNHNRLLRSDEGMAELGYRDFSCAAGHTCTDPRFETAKEETGWGIFSQKLVFSGGKWMGMDDSGAVVAVKLQKSGAFVGQVGDADLNGVIDPADLLCLYDPNLPEAWREWARGRLVDGNG